ncbi:sigma factor-like helix-turn-helix DNA-binding protein [Aquimarina gracilis]|uniref:Sigma factor-like helix-turn-helix DNA-binding protein n=1 Tax=Aquimarina gracilis TaxID=874422 RepID=A0ABU5ZRM2_9FLAO|nr:sigma factor-like helix-turn-helix DNA-binding protein [Aquimarina gracilis]MEB3344599.1 sigma factor-like helix-turn-helix DNA-binding protein [Aquimarina gracilis]
MFITIEYTVTAIVCLISAVVIQRIFSKEKLRGADQNAIEGIKWFGLAIFVWGLGALVNLVLVTWLKWPATNKILIYFGVLVSLANSLFIILSLPSIEHQQKPGILVRLVQRFSIREFVGVYCGVLGMIAFVFIASSYGNEEISNNFIWLIDIPISILVAISLLFELNKAFKGRQMKFMYLPTLVLFVLIIVAVSHRIIPQDKVLQFIDQQFWSVLGSITAISFKFLFILLFSILLYSWKFLSEKEQQQNLAQKLEVQNTKLNKAIEQLELANESHLDTIKSLKRNLKVLKETAKIEFSERQKEVLGYLAHYGDDKSYTEIAKEMHISVDGFQTHIHQIKKMLNISGSSGKEQLIKFAKANNFLKYTSLKDDA